MRKTRYAGGWVFDHYTSQFHAIDILVQDDRIETVGAPDNPVSGETVVNVRGKWIIPGLIDMHCHIKDGFAPEFLAAGVTTVRNTAGNLLELRDLREAESDSPTPRVISTDRLIDGPPGLWANRTTPYQFLTSDPVEARGEVVRQTSAGADFIKVYGLLSHDTMSAVANAAREQGLQVSADIMHSSEVNALDAVNLGIKFLEHASGILQSYDPTWSMKSDPKFWEGLSRINIDLNRVTRICEELITANVAICPTLVLYDQSRLGVKFWNPNNLVSRSSAQNNGWYFWESLLERHVEPDSLGVQTDFVCAVTETYYRLGGEVLIGTDTPAGLFTFPGMALHRELELMTKCGVSPERVLTMATRDAAFALGKPELGSISPAALADFVILDENPVENITNTQQISSIVKGGKQWFQAEILARKPTPELISKKFEWLEEQLGDLGFG